MRRQVLTAARHTGNGAYGWVIVGLAILSQIAANGLPINSLSLFLQDWTKELHSSVSQLLLAMLAMGLVLAVVSPIVGVIADRWSTRWLIGLGLLGMAAFCFAISLVTATWQIWGLYGLLLPPSFSACAAIPANALVSRWFVERRGLALGFTALGVGIGGLLLPPLVAHSVPIIGWRSVWRIGGLVIGLVVLPLIVLLVRDRPADDSVAVEPLEGATKPLHSVHGARATDERLSWIELLTRKNLWFLIATYVPIAALSNGAQQNLAPIVASQHLAATTAGLMLSILSAAHLVATPVVGWICDRFGTRAPLAALALITALGGVCLGFAVHPRTLGLGAALVGIGGGIWALLPAALAHEFGPSNIGRAFGFLMLFIPINLAVPALIARSQELTGSYGPAMSALAFLTALGAVFAVFMQERKPTGVTWHS
jgi:MFS transporter, OFA family, oxalate/formate antiporter